MSTVKYTAVQQLDALIGAYLEDLLELPEQAILPNPEQVAMQSAAFREIKKAAAAKAGQRRMARAKRAVAARTQDTRPRRPVDLAEARRYLAEAANDARITLAARDLQNMPDEEVERLYLQLKELAAARAIRKD